MIHQKLLKIDHLMEKYHNFLTLYLLQATMNQLSMDRQCGATHSFAFIECEASWPNPSHLACYGLTQKTQLVTVCILAWVVICVLQFENLLILPVNPAIHTNTFLSLILTASKLKKLLTKPNYLNLLESNVL